jgi:hypothetical protein
MALVNLTFEQRTWILKCCWRTENAEYPSRSTDLTPLDTFLWGGGGILKKCFLHLNTTHMQDLRRDIEIACAAVPLATIQNICQQCIAAGGGHSEHS